MAGRRRAVYGRRAPPPTGASRGRAEDNPGRMDRQPHATAPTGQPGAGQPDPSRIERLCVERGLKMTGQRRLIARVLSEAEDHPDVEELYRRASALDARISIATVYRTVRLLEEKGIVERRDFGGGRARFDPTDRGHHHHLIDVDTGKVIEFEDGAFERVAQAIAERLGFSLIGQRLELFGRRTETRPPRPARKEPG